MFFFSVSNECKSGASNAVFDAYSPVSFCFIVKSQTFIIGTLAAAVLNDMHGINVLYERS